MCVGRVDITVLVTITKFLKKELRRGSVRFDSQIEGSVHHGGKDVVLRA